MAKPTLSNRDWDILAAYASTRPGLLRRLNRHQCAHMALIAVVKQYRAECPCTGDPDFTNQEPCEICKEADASIAKATGQR